MLCCIMLCYICLKINNSINTNMLKELYITFETNLYEIIASNL